MAVALIHRPSVAGVGREVLPGKLVDVRMVWLNTRVENHGKDVGVARGKLPRFGSIHIDVRHGARLADVV